MLVLITTPPASGMAVCDEIRESVDRTVGRINGRFRTLNWAPVHYLFRSVPCEEATCYYAAADVMWITPLRTPWGEAELSLSPSSLERPLSCMELSSRTPTIYRTWPTCSAGR